MTLVDASPLGQFAGQVVALAYDDAKTKSKIGDFCGAGGKDCQGNKTCWMPTNMTAPRALYTNYASTLETTTVSTKSVSTETSSRVVATRDATFITTLIRFSILTNFKIPSVTVTVPVTITQMSKNVHEKSTITTIRIPTTLATSITVPATLLTTATTKTTAPTTATTETTTKTSFTYTLTETTTTTTTHILTSVSNAHTIITISTMT